MSHISSKVYTPGCAHCSKKGKMGDMDVLEGKHQSELK